MATLTGTGPTVIRLAAREVVHAGSAEREALLARVLREVEEARADDSLVDSIAALLAGTDVHETERLHELLELLQALVAGDGERGPAAVPWRPGGR
jgi:hypothetical protein